MPSSERQRAKNQQLALDVRHHLGLKIDNQFQSGDPWIRVYSAMFNGALEAALTALAKCDSIAKAWGTGNQQKATALSEVFALALLSRWSRMWESRGRKTSPEGRKNTAGDILRLFGTHSEDSLGWFVKLDEQFNFEADLAEGKIPGSVASTVQIEERLLQLRALKACGDRLTLDLSTLSFPMTWDIEFRMPLGLMGGTTANDPFEHLAFRACVIVGAKTMVDMWRESRTS